MKEISKKELQQIAGGMSIIGCMPNPWWPKVPGPWQPKMPGPIIIPGPEPIPRPVPI